MAFAPDAFTSVTRGGRTPDRLARASNSQSYAFRCADGELLAVHLSAREKFWQNFLHAIDAPDLGTDVRFAKHAQRARNYIALRAELTQRLLARPRAEWLQRLADADVPAAPILSIAEALDDPQVNALGSSYETEHPIEGMVRSICCPVLIDNIRPRNRMTAPPTLGEHTQEVLAELSTRMMQDEKPE